jgi:hypothetical protein
VRREVGLARQPAAGRQPPARDVSDEDAQDLFVQPGYVVI